MEEKVREEIEKTGIQVAAGSEYGISEHAYLHLTQQIQESRNYLDEKIERVRDNLDGKIDSTRNYLDGRMDNLENKVDNLKFWALGTVIAVFVGTGGIIATLAVLFA